MPDKFREDNILSHVLHTHVQRNQLVTCFCFSCLGLKRHLRTQKTKGCCKGSFICYLMHLFL